MFGTWVHGFRFRFRLRVCQPRITNCDSRLSENAKPPTLSPQKHKPEQTLLTTARLYMRVPPPCPLGFPLDANGREPTGE